MTTAAADGRHPDIWRKFTPRQSVIRYAWMLGIVFVAVMLVAIFGVVVFSEWVSATVRQKIT